MHSNTVLVVLAVMSMFTIIVAMILEHDKRKHKKAAEPPPPPPPSRTSALAGLSLFCGLAALGLSTASGIITACVSMGEITGIPADVHPHIDLAARIVLY